MSQQPKEVSAFIRKARQEDLDQVKVRGRSSTSASAFPIGAASTVPILRPSVTRKHSNTVSTLRRPLPSPPKITIAAVPASARPLPSPVSSPSALSPQISTARPTRPKRARTQSASGRIPLGSRPVGRNASFALDANIDAARNTLVIRPLKSPERSTPKRIPIASPERSYKHLTSPERRYPSSLERKPPQLPPPISLTPQTRSPSIPRSTPPIIAGQRQPDYSPLGAHSQHSRNNSASTRITASPTSSPPPTAGLRLNTSFTSHNTLLSQSATLGSTPLPSPIPSPSASFARPNFPTKSRTLPLAPFSSSNYPSQPNTISSSHSHPPGAIASPSPSSAASSSYSTPYNSSAYRLHTPDSASTIPTPDTTASLATPDSITPPSSSHSGTVRSSVAARRMGVVTNVRIRSGSIDDNILPHDPDLMRSAPVFFSSPVHDDDDDETPSIPSHLKGKGKARESQLRLSRSMDVDLDDYPTHLSLNSKRRSRSTRSQTSLSSSEGESGVPTPAATQVHYPTLPQRKPPQPHLLIPTSISGQKQQHPFGPDGLSPMCSSAEDDYVSPLAFSKDGTHGPSPSISPHPHQRQMSQNSFTTTTVYSTLAAAPSPSNRSPASQIPSPIGSSEGDEGEHSHPALLDDMISLAPSRRARESGFYASGLTFSPKSGVNFGGKIGRRMTSGSVGGFSLGGGPDEERLQQQRWSISSLLPPPQAHGKKIGSDGSSPIEMSYYDNSYSPATGVSPVSPFSARPGSSNSEEGAFNWSAVLASGATKGMKSVRGRGGKGKGNRRRRQSWGGMGSELSSPISAGVSRSPFGGSSRVGGEREKSLSPIRYANGIGSMSDEDFEGMGFSDPDVDLGVGDHNDLGVMPVEEEMRFAAGISDEEDGFDSDEGGLDVLGMPRERKRVGPRVHSRVAASGRHRSVARRLEAPSSHSSEDNLDLRFTGGRGEDADDDDERRISRSRSRRGGFSSDDEPLPPLPSSLGTRFSVGRASSQQMGMTSGAFPSIQSKVIAGGSVGRATSVPGILTARVSPPITTNVPQYANPMPTPSSQGFPAPPRTAPVMKGKVSRPSKGTLKKPPPKRSKSVDTNRMRIDSFVGVPPTPPTPCTPSSLGSHKKQTSISRSVGGSLEGKTKPPSLDSTHTGSQSSNEFAVGGGMSSSMHSHGSTGSRQFARNGKKDQLPYGIAHIHSEAVGFYG